MGQRQSKGLRRQPPEPSPTDASSAPAGGGLLRRRPGMQCYRPVAYESDQATCPQCSRCFRPEAFFRVDARKCLELHMLQRHDITSDGKKPPPLGLFPGYTRPTRGRAAGSCTFAPPTRSSSALVTDSESDNSERGISWSRVFKCMENYVGVSAERQLERELYELCAGDGTVESSGTDYLRLIELLDLDPVVFENEQNRRQHYKQILSEQAEDLRFRIRHSSSAHSSSAHLAQLDSEALAPVRPWNKLFKQTRSGEGVRDPPSGSLQDINRSSNSNTSNPPSANSICLMLAERRNSLMEKRRKEFSAEKFFVRPLGPGEKPWGLRKIVNLNAKHGPKQVTPLVAAVLSGRREVVQLLLNTIKSEPVHTMLAYATSCGLPHAAAAVKNLTSGTLRRWHESGKLTSRGHRPHDKEIQFDETSGTGETALSAAVRNTDSDSSGDIVKDLLECYEANLDARTAEAPEEEAIHVEQVAKMLLGDNPAETVRMLGRNAIAAYVAHFIRRRQRDSRVGGSLGDPQAGMESDISSVAGRCVDLCAQIGVQVELQRAKSEPECHVCYEPCRPPIFAVNPCGHAPFCESCADYLMIDYFMIDDFQKRCPVCRGNITGFLKVYMRDQE
ncbi:unnamed protein product [Amoebophrya sp. A120]|nr:unnamed protein product [Amoebophrya sp. A120]|eukprot:GSA120T00020770001.1